MPSLRLVIATVGGLGGFAWEAWTLYSWGMGWAPVTQLDIVLFFLSAVPVTIALAYFVKHDHEWLDKFHE
jgi:hypothetical protein